MIKRYKATFWPQAWQNDNAVDVDPEGETSWEVSSSWLEEAHQRLGPDVVFDRQSQQTDFLRDDPAAPEWVREWRGPFWVEAEEIVTVMDDHAVAVIDNAINEVMNAYAEAGWTFDGVIDVGDHLQALGDLVGRNLVGEARETYEEER